MFDHREWSSLDQLIAAYSGNHLKTAEQTRLASYILQRIRKLGVEGIEDYRQRLMAEQDDHADTDPTSEWSQLIEQVTIGESFFFRDHGQINLLRYQILPDLLQSRQSRRRLRVWSIGCAAGEELYTVAILLQQLLPDWRQWQLELVGSDISYERLQRATAGHYRGWALRGMEQGEITRYFEGHRERYLLHQNIREMARFEHLNLLDDRFLKQGKGPHEVDLILFRNVLIYFDRESANQVVDTITRRMADGGYLLTGHTELLRIRGDDLGLHAVHYPESVIYQRSDGHTVSPKVPSISLQLAPLPDLPDACSVGQLTDQETDQDTDQKKRETEPCDMDQNEQLQQAIESFHSGAYLRAMEEAEEAADHFPLHARLLQSQCLANLGDYRQAEVVVDEVLSDDPFLYQGYYLKSQLKELTGETEQAIQLLEKVLYLNQNFIPAYLDLAASLERDSRSERARRLRASAGHLLSRLPANQTIEPYGEITASELHAYLQKLQS